MLSGIQNQLLLGGVLSLLAGLSTGIGAALALFVRRTDTRLLTFALGASAGVMVYISFMELMPTAAGMLETSAGWVTTLAFFGGMALACGIDRLIPEDENPHEVPAPGQLDGVQATGEFVGNARLRRSALLFTLAIAIHNFPEGIAVALPRLYGTGNRRQAFGWARLSGLAEPLGALVGMLILIPFLSPALLAILCAVVAGIMVYISFDELLPMAERWGHHHLSIYGVATGMLVMALVL